MNILLIEDDPVHVKLVQRVLKKSGLNNPLTIIRDGEKALNYLLNQKDESPGEKFPRLILMDINLPKVNGLEILRRIKQSPKLQYIPVVILTTSCNRTDLEKCYEYHLNFSLFQDEEFLSQIE